MKKVLICGSRSIDDVNLDNYISHLEVDEVISGGAVGVDTLAENWASRHGIKTTIVRPDYDRYGKAAPIVRDAEMVDMCDYVVAVWDGYSRGTKATI